MFFDTWKIYTHRELKRKAEERQVGTEDSRSSRIKQAKNRFMKKHALHAWKKVKIKDINWEIGKYLATVPRMT